MDKHTKQMFFRICHLTTVHPPFDTRIFHKEMKSLAKAGYSVTLIAKYDKEETINSVKINPLKTPKNRIVRLTKTLLECYRKAIKVDADLYHFHDPELIIIGWLLKRRGKKVIYDVHEDVPRQIRTKEWIWKPVRLVVARVTGFLEKTFSHRFDGVICATPSIAENFEYLRGRVNVVHNYPLLGELFRSDENPEEWKNRSNAVVYVGGITVNRGIKEMIQAIEMIPSSYNAKLLLGGKFIPSSLGDAAKKMPGWNQVEYLGWLDRTQVGDTLTKARAGLVLIHPEPRYMVSLPVKMFEYMSAGLPVIASHFPLWKDIIEGNRSGLTVDPQNPTEIAGAIQYIFDNPQEAVKMGRRGREAVETKYNWLSEEKKLLEDYSRILNNGK
jgi:glycosyltransferase involved in cell wall biosynthesis